MYLFIVHTDGEYGDPNAFAVIAESKEEAEQIVNNDEEMHDRNKIIGIDQVSMEKGIKMIAYSCC